MKHNTCNYSVSIDLQSSEYNLSKSQLSTLEKQLSKISDQDSDFPDICSLRKGILRYESETLIPQQIIDKKQKILIVLGNPATHSVKNGMFFYSRANGSRHGFWGKLKNAGLVSKVIENTRQEEAELRRNMIMDCTASEKYLVGLTTFYSFPTPGPDNICFSGVKGVETLFAPIMDQLINNESWRILSYAFTDGAILVFTQQSSLHQFRDITGVEPVYWPIRGKGSGGKRLAELISQGTPVEVDEYL